MDLIEVIVKLTGVAPVLMHNIRLLDPTDHIVKGMKEITSKRKKTETDLEELKRLEFEGGLYIDAKGPYIPSEWIESMIRDGAKKNKLGKTASAAVFCTEDRFHLDFKGPKTVVKLFAQPEYVDTRGVVVGRARVLRTRPKFPEWSVTFSAYLNTEVMDLKDFERAIQQAGLMVGLGDYRPKYGRFTVNSIQKAKAAA